MPTLSLLQPRISKVGRLAARLRDGEEIASAISDDDNSVLEWMRAFGLAEADRPGNIYQLLTLLEHRIEAIIDATPIGSPVTVLAAFERRSGRAGRHIYSGKAASPQKALQGCLLEAVETNAARWTGEHRMTQERAAEVLSFDRERLTVSGRDLLSGRRTAVPADRVFLDAPPASPCAESCRREQRPCRRWELRGGQTSCGARTRRKGCRRDLVEEQAESSSGLQGGRKPGRPLRPGSAMAPEPRPPAGDPLPAE